MHFRNIESGPSPLLPPMSSPLPPQSPSRPQSLPPASGRSRSMAAYLQQDICCRHADLVLIVCSYIAGLCDSGVFEAWSCFVSMQTGNTIFLGLGAAGLPLKKPYGWLRSLVAIATFLLGCVLFATTRYARPRSRGTLSASFLVQAVCLTVAAVLVRTGVVETEEVATASFLPLLPIALLAFQGGGQVWTGEVLGFREIPTTVLTSIYFGLAADTHFWQFRHGGLRGNPKRNRRLAAVVALLLGAISAGWLSRSKRSSGGGIPAIFFVAAGLKYLIALAWLAWPAEKPKPVEVETLAA